MVTRFKRELRIISASSDQTAALGAELGALLQPGDPALPLRRAWRGQDRLQPRTWCWFRGDRRLDQPDLQSCA